MMAILTIIWITFLSIVNALGLIANLLLIFTFMFGSHQLRSALVGSS